MQFRAAISGTEIFRWVTISFDNVQQKGQCVRVGNNPARGTGDQV